MKFKMVLIVFLLLGFTSIAHAKSDLALHLEATPNAHSSFNKTGEVEYAPTVFLTLESTSAEPIEETMIKIPAGKIGGCALRNEATGNFEMVAVGGNMIEIGPLMPGERVFLKIKYLGLFDEEAAGSFAAYGDDSKARVTVHQDGSREYHLT